MKISAVQCLPLLFTALFAGAAAAPERLTSEQVEAAFQSFVSEYGKSYANDPEELSRRLEIFRDNVRAVEEINSGPGQTWEAGLNEYADLTWEEFQGRVLMAEQDCSATQEASLRSNKGLLRTSAPPHSRKRYGRSLSYEFAPWFDWRMYGVLSPVKNQGHCGSCWTFSSTGSMEAHMALKNMRKELASGEVDVSCIRTQECGGFFKWAKTLSEQQLIDCARGFDNHGCHGGLPSHAFSYIHWQGGQDTENSYPYQDGGIEKHPKHTCRYNASKIDVAGVVPGGPINITAFDEDELFEAVATMGPVSIAYEVVRDFRFYKKGVYSSPKCSTDRHKVNHAVVAVGYGTHEGKDYWIMRNSWGASFGMAGHFWIERGVNMCGLADCTSYPDVYRGAIPEIEYAHTHAAMLHNHINSQQAPVSTVYA